MYRIILVVAAYISIQMLADVGALKIALIAGISIDAGTLIYPITFTLRDLAHKTLGLSGVRLLIITAAIINVLMALFFAFSAALPPDLAVGPQTAYAEALNPAWRIVLASIAAEVIAELLDTEAYHQFVTRITRRYQWLRVLVSNALSAPVDSVVFVALAFAGAVPGSVLVSLVVVNIVVKMLMTVASLPMIYAVPERDAHAHNLSRVMQPER